jgi:hypothetical protein
MKALLAYHLHKTWRYCYTLVRITGACMRFIVILFIFVLATPPLHAQSTAGVEFGAGLGGQIESKLENAGATQHDLRPTWIITPWVESPFGSAGGIGPEVNFIWIKADRDEHERRLIVSPHLRLRMSFPIVPKVTFDSFLSIGPSWWTEDQDSGEGVPGLENRFGWGLRFGFGGSYRLNAHARLYAHMGYMTTTSYGDQVTLTADAIPISIGLRATY